MFQVVHGILTMDNSSHQIDIKKIDIIVVYILYSTFGTGPNATLESSAFFEFAV